MKKIIRMTESDLTRLVKRVIREQAAAKTPDLEAIKKQIVGKKVGLTSTGKFINSDGPDTKLNFQDGDVFTTFLIEDATTNYAGEGLIMSGKDLKAVDNRGVDKIVLELGQVNISTLTWRGCKKPKNFTAKGMQRVGYSSASPNQLSKGEMGVSNPALSDILFKAFGCAADIDTTPDFQP
jgi:hypothetical protein